MFYGGLDNPEFEDFDDDGVLELYGYTGSTTGGAFLYDRLEMAFKLVHNKYTVSYDATWKFLSKRQAKAEQDFANNPNDNFYHLLTLDATHISHPSTTKNSNFAVNIWIPQTLTHHTSVVTAESHKALHHSRLAAATAGLSH